MFHATDTQEGTIFCVEIDFHMRLNAKGLLGGLFSRAGGAGAVGAS